MFHTTFVQIGEFDWLSGLQKGSIFVKTFKTLLDMDMFDRKISQN